MAVSEYSASISSLITCRPALVIGVDVVNGQPAVDVCYGTSQKTHNLYPGEFLIEPLDGADFVQTSLAATTKFDLQVSVELPYCSTYFGVAPKANFGQTPKLGSITATIFKRASAVAALINKK